ncbi:HAMP domain-containing protein [Micromonospora nigra]|uniref:histidine kinase n=1 Tax=Micromonospora nigra TaxID=145857 RepID=A0A1C6SIY9_9ACTN|nr:nitrate- and nitrite sensing domain-containing protein [Micromonospora nigra]SCL29393.1 HAMP domain-containing protein [Micromonospora nigra]
MGSRTINLRQMVALMVAALILLWAFAAWMTLRDGAHTLGASEVNGSIYEPSEPLIVSLQHERRASAVFLADSDRDRTDLDAVRRDTDAATAVYAERTRRWQARLAASDETQRLISAALDRLDALTTTRQSVDALAIDRPTVVADYTSAIDSLFRIYDSLSKIDDEQIANIASALIDVKRAWEVMSQEEALLAGALTAGQLDQAEHAQFTKLVGVWRFLVEDTAHKLPAEDAAALRQLVDSGPLVRLRQYEDRVVAGADRPLRLSPGDWQAAVQDARTGVNDVILARGDALVAQSVPVVLGVAARLLFATGLGAVMVAAALMGARHLIRRMEGLRRDAHRLATDTLPDVVDRLGRGDKVDVEAEAPDLAYGRDELGQVGEAFNAARRTAVRAAVEQAELRRDVADMFLNIARRTQALVHRQLSVLTDMERAEEDADALEKLFDVDHLATRMRRNAENLIVLTGANTPRQWKRDVPMLDVVRGAVAEVEDYTRVTVAPMPDVRLAGRAVADATHLVAELIENALSFSPPNTPVQVTGQVVANGFAIEIEDRGLGMPAEDMATANTRLAAPGEFRLSDSSRLGLFVVGRLATRLAVRVHLKESAYGGTTAVVLIPAELLGEAPAEPLPVAALRGPDAQTQPLAVVAARPAPTVDGQRATPGVREARPVADGGESAASVDDVPGTVTEAGLPKRVRRTTRSDPPATASPPRAAPAPRAATAASRDPEAVRRKMSAFQDGTRKGRAAADDEQPGAPQSPADS